MTVPHGPHIHPRPWCSNDECLGHTWPLAIDRYVSYGHKLFGDKGAGLYPCLDPEVLRAVVINQRGLDVLVVGQPVDEGQRVLADVALQPEVLQRGVQGDAVLDGGLGLSDSTQPTDVVLPLGAEVVQQLLTDEDLPNELMGQATLDAEGKAVHIDSLVAIGES